MLTKSMLVGAILTLSSTIALGGPCNTNTANRDAGSGPAETSSTSQTTGTASSNAKEHPPTSTMNKASENTATSSQDAQRQMQGQPTAAEQSKTNGSTTDKDC